MRRNAGAIDSFLRRRASAMRAAQTTAEATLWNLLRPCGFERQCPVMAHSKNGGHFPYILDFFHRGLRLCIEADGGIHKHQRGHDRRRDTRLGQLGLKTLRLTNKAILKPQARVTIAAAIIGTVTA
jgi:very-short-patch-repair endonuclease